MSRSTRRRLGSIDLLPREADEDIAWAAEALRQRRSTQEAIRHELCNRLTEKSLRPVSKGAFSRWCSRLQFDKDDSPGDPVERAPYPVALSDETRRLLAQALCSLAGDLVRDVPVGISKEELEAARTAFLGMPARGGLVYKDGQHVYVPSRDL